MIRETISVIRDFGRLRTIAGILMRYGWGDVAKRLGKGSLIGRAGNAITSEVSPEILQLPAEVRRGRLQSLQARPTRHVQRAVPRQWLDHRVRER